MQIRAIRVCPCVVNGQGSSGALLMMHCYLPSSPPFLTVHTASSSENAIKRVSHSKTPLTPQCLDLIPRHTPRSSPLPPHPCTWPAPHQTWTAACPARPAPPLQTRAAPPRAACASSCGASFLPGWRRRRARRRRRPSLRAPPCRLRPPLCRPRCPRLQRSPRGRWRRAGVLWRRWGHGRRLGVDEGQTMDWG